MKLNSGNSTTLFYTVFFICLRKDSFQTICYYDSWLYHALPWAKWNWLPSLSSDRSGTALAPKEWGLAKLLAAFPGVYLCFVPAWRLGGPSFSYFSSLFITSVHIQGSRKECLEFCCWQQRCRTRTGAPSPAGTKPTWYLNLSASNSQTPLNKCLFFKVIFPGVTVA